MGQIDQLLTLASTYAAHVNRSEATVSSRITTHARLFKRLRAGHGCTLATLERAFEWFAANWPADLEWPADIPRPDVEQRRAAS